MHTVTLSEKGSLILPYNETAFCRGHHIMLDVCLIISL